MSASTSSPRRCRRSCSTSRRTSASTAPIGSTCEIVDGVYTGRTLRAAHGEGKARALRELAEAEGFDLSRSTAYSDSYSDVPFLEAVGHPVAANPDRKLRRIAAERGWPVVQFAS